MMMIMMMILMMILMIVMIDDDDNDDDNGDNNDENYDNDDNGGDDDDDDDNAEVTIFGPKVLSPRACDNRQTALFPRISVNEVLLLYNEFGNLTNSATLPV